MGVWSSRPTRLALLGGSSGILLASLLLLRRARRGRAIAERGSLASVASVPPPEGMPSAPSKRTGPSPEVREWAKRLVDAAGAGDADLVSQQLREAPGDLESLLAIDACMDNWTNLTAVGAAAVGGHSHVLHALLHARANPDVRCINATSWDGSLMLTKRITPMCIAAQGGHQECVQVLLQGRANPNVHCHSEYLEGAVEWGDSDDGSDMIYYSALDAANQAKHHAIAELIRQGGGRESSEAAPERPARMKVSSGSRMGA